MVVNIRWSKVEDGVKVFQNIRSAFKTEFSLYGEAAGMTVQEENLIFVSGNTWRKFESPWCNSGQPVWNKPPPSGNDVAECMLAYLCLSGRDACTTHQPEFLETLWVERNFKFISLNPSWKKWRICLWNCFFVFKCSLLKSGMMKKGEVTCQTLTGPNCHQKKVKKSNLNVSEVARRCWSESDACWCNSGSIST